MKLLPPQRLRPHYYEGVEEELRGAFREFLFNPLLFILQEATTQADEFRNAAPAPSPELLLALRRGTVQYVGGVFAGDFDARLGAALRALGAQWDARSGVYRLPEWTAPGWLKAEAAAAQRRALVVHDKLQRELARIQERLEAGQLRAPIVDASQPVEAIEEGFESAADALSIRKRIPPAQRRAMEARYAADVRPYVVEATAEYIDDLHKVISANAAAGYRYDGLVEEIEHAVGISERKARFIARQETGLFMAGYRRERFEAAGVTRYKWSTSHDIRVRPYAGNDKLKRHGDHRVLDGQIFTYARKAPAQYMSTKKPENPGTDYNCRCVDLPILE